MSATVARIRELYAMPIAGADDAVKLVAVLTAMRGPNLGEEPRDVAEGLANLLWEWLREKRGEGVICDYSTGVVETVDGPVVKAWIRYRQFPYVYDTMVYFLVTQNAVLLDGVVHLKGLGLTCSGVFGALEWALFAPFVRLRRRLKRRWAACNYDVKMVRGLMDTDIGRAVAERVGKYACRVRAAEEALYVLLNVLKIDAAGALYEDHVERPHDVAKDVAKAVGHWLLKLVDAGVLDAGYAKVGDGYAAAELWHGNKYVEVRVYVGREGLRPALSKVCVRSGRSFGGPFC